MFQASFLPSRNGKKSTIPNIIRLNDYDKTILDLIEFDITDNDLLNTQKDKKLQDVFIDNHRGIVRKIFSKSMLRSVLHSLFLYNVPLIQINSEIPLTKKNNIQITDIEYYAEISKMLVKTGIDQIIKQLHPKKERNLVCQLEFFSEMISRLNISESEIVKEFEEK